MFQKNSGTEKVNGGERGEHHDFPSKSFGLTVLRNLVRESFKVSLISGLEKIFASEGYVTIFVFLSKIFCLRVPKNFVGEPFCAVFQKKFGCQKVNG